MSHISFSAELDTKKLDDAIKQSNKTIKDWSKDVEKAGGQADKGLEKMAKSFKEAIKEQKQLIKDIEADVKKLQKAYDDAAAGKAKSATGAELGSAKRALSEEKARLDQLQKAQIEANKEEEGSIGGVIDKLKKWALGLATVGAAMKIGKAIIDSTESTTHAFNVVVAEATAGVGYFFKAIASGDWSNFRKGLTDSMNSARQFIDDMEDIENRQNEQKIKNAETSSKINELREGTFDRDIENNDKLITNLKEIIELQKKDYAAQALIAKDKYNDTLRDAAVQNKIDKDKLDNLIAEYTLNKETIELGEKYNVLQIRIEASRKPAFNVARTKEIQAEINALGEGAEAAGKMAEKFGNVPPPLRKFLAELKAEQIKLEGLAKIGSKFDERRLATAENVKKKAEEDAKKKAIEDAKTENQIKIQQELLNKAVEKGNDKDAKAIAERISELKKELEIRNKIAQSLVDNAGYEGFIPTQLKIPGMPSVLPKAKPKQKTWEKLQEEKTSLKSFNMKTFNDEKKHQKELSEDEQKALEEQLKLRNQIVQAVAGLVNQIGQQIGLDEKSMGLLNAGLDAFTQLATGDIIGAAASMIAGIISQIPSAASRFEAQITRINLLLEEQARLIELSKQTGGQDAERKKELEYLDQKAAKEKKEYERLQLQADTHIDLLGWRQNLADKAYEAWQATTDLIEDSNAALKEFYTNTTALAVADAISQGFQDGKTSAADFADTFNGFMISAINTALEEMSKPEIAAWYKQFAIDMESGGGLSKEEIDALKIDWDKIIAEGKANRDAVMQATGVNLNASAVANAGLTGQIQRSITEETGSELAGLFRRFADDERAVKDYSLAGVNHLVGIEANTYGSWQELIKANSKLDTVISNTKQVPTGAL